MNVLDIISTISILLAGAAGAPQCRQESSGGGGPGGGEGARQDGIIQETEGEEDKAIK